MSKSYDSICCFRSKDSSELRLLWEITTVCNLNCSFCHRSRPYKNGPSFDTIKGMIPKLKAIGVSEIILSGGEPLTRTDIFDIVELLKTNNFNLDICTNAYCLNQNIAKKLSEYFREISVSLDSFQESVHNSLRLKKDAYQRTLNGIVHLLECGLDVHVTMLINRITFPFITETVTKLYNMGIRSIALIGEIPVRGGEYYILHENIQQEIYEVVDSLRHRFSDLSLNTKEIFSKCEYMKCPAGHSILAIDVNGYLAPCLLLGNAEKINLTSCSISDIIPYYLELNKRNQHNECSNMMGICPGSKIVFNAGKEENINDQG